MSYQDDLLDEVDAAKQINNFSPKLGIGRHKVALKRMRIKKSTKDGGAPVAEIDVVVIESTVHAKGETRGWPWFVGLPAPAGGYQKARLGEFTTAVKTSIGDVRPGKEVNADLLSPQQKGRGLVLIADVVQAYKDGQPLMGKKGPVTNVTWTPVSQTIEQVAATRAQIDKMEAMATAAAPPTAVQAVTQAATPAHAHVTQPDPTSAPAASGLGGLGSILG